ncbi:MAG: 5,10-methylenetetrahydrofolate reductase [Chloroflexi bacterium CG_4_9_14_3_um_filter_45_9]|nr:MAG: hypothetical protein AUK00_00580 [Dehalococcoidia bacterium CG2_30_46_9]PIU22985.1 MAG: 5,10-methylenetetrahydrofolate reductase [Chloroflexi bacterium CG08_land_8_20_14_0_20_45_12]PIX27232.1 MAG: 5,10-methylenetetrahydrofolate reductase [Chloroflexi bacterium CG_4_8_14_3_um_filter_45_15]PJB50146.1 MAG: 5,10-methylenetetrahydrofolate reductase [Chloroflexi bacterium CG_4_9_14_3_um_filter_45_9]
MKTITEQKPLEEIQALLEKKNKIYLIGCGTCATLCHTGGNKEVLEMKEKLIELGKEVTESVVIPTACDNLVGELLKEFRWHADRCDAILVMACALGVQNVVRHNPGKLVYPALNTLFIGVEEEPGRFTEVCSQCGDCILGRTVGVCPVTACAKGLLNGPCGGSQNGKCEVSPERDCAWAKIVEKLEELGELDKLEEIAEPKDWSKMERPRSAIIASV